LLRLQQHQISQGRYRGNDWNGYIADEPLIANPEYFRDLSAAGIAWGFFSGASRGSASHILDRLQIKQPVLVAMEDAPGKPDPTGLFQVIQALNKGRSLNSPQTVIYVGDTVADMITILKAREINPSHHFLAVGVIPPHIQEADSFAMYKKLMGDRGADLVLNSVLELTPARIAELLA
jgi:HAD superfamily phosphatase